MRYRLDRFRLADRDRREPRQVRSERGEPEGADGDADEHEAEHRADMQAVEQRDDDGGGAEDDQRLPVEGGIERSSFHPRNVAGPADRSRGIAPASDNGDRAKTRATVIEDRRNALPLFRWGGRPHGIWCHSSAVKNTNWRPS